MDAITQRRVAGALKAAASARIAIYENKPCISFWTMPAGRAVALSCWHQNMQAARKARLASQPTTEVSAHV